MMRRSPKVALVGAALALLLGAWVFSTPPFGGPDEAAHYLRAVNIANGKLLGPKVPYSAPTAEQTAWVQHDVRGVLVPAPLAPPGSSCVGGRPDVTAHGCVMATYTGDYPPLSYLLPALAISQASRSSTALWAARVASALPCLAFLVLAFALLWSGTAWSVLGLLAAITPMTLFIASVINPNGLELAASLAFSAGVLRISRAPTTTSVTVWGALVISGAVTVLAWQLGWLFVVGDAILFAALLGRGQLATLIRARRRRLRAVLALLLAAFALYLVYGLNTGVVHGAFGMTPIGGSLHQGLFQLHNALYGAVGVFGALVVGLPSGTYWIWWLLVLALAAGGLVAGGQRERLVMLFVTALALAFPVLFYAWVFRHSGFGLQARYVMPVLALVPLLGGELIYRSYTRLTAPAARTLPSVAVIAIAGFQLFAWWINARDWASEPDALWFLSHPHWSPPLGWGPWTAMALIGAALLVGFAVGEARGLAQKTNSEVRLTATA